MIDEAEGKVAWGISVGSMYWSACGISLHKDETHLVKHRKERSTPASVLLGWAFGEPPRLDCWMPPHPRGTGSNWPLDAIVNCDNGSGRFPLAAAWTGRLQNLSWHWKPDGDVRQLDSLDAICFGTANLAKIHAHKAFCSIVIPNDFKQREQQKLLDACGAIGVNASLIWLPVAAVLAWIKNYRGSLPDPCQNSVERLYVPVIHADWGSIRCSTLSLVVRNDEHGTRWMPARSRPTVRDWDTFGFGWCSAGGCNSTSAADVWRGLFGNSDKHFVRDGVSNSTLLQQITQWPVRQSTPTEVDSKLAAYLTSIPSPTAVVFVGDFASQVSTGPKVGQFLASHNTVIADGRKGEDFLALGASIFSRDQLENRTSYLDTLPNLELFVDRNSQYEWMRLMGDTDQFVAGGQNWELPYPIEGLSVRRGASSIKLVVAHDEYDGVRELVANLEHPAEHRLSAKLLVSATAAQGNARLQLVTEACRDVPSKSILAKWDKMRLVLDLDGKSVDKQMFMKMQPRAYPELMQRRMSLGKWRAVLPLVQEFNDLVASESPESLLRRKWRFHRLKDQLLAKDQSQSPHDATAVSSDSKVPFGQESLELLKTSLLAVWKIGRKSNSTVISTVIRALGYVSVDDREFEDWLAENFRNRFHDPQCVLHTSGLTMRSPFNIAKLVDFVFFENYQLKSPSANELKAISQVLRYRNDATKEICSRNSEQIIRTCLRIFKRGMEKGGGSYPFRWASLIVVYMLRRRMFEVDFLDPENELAMSAKELFRTAIELYQQRRLRPLGGSVDLPAALEQMINYIDRKGTGDILMAGE